MEGNFGASMMPAYEEFIKSLQGFLGFDKGRQTRLATNVTGGFFLLVGYRAFSRNTFQAQRPS